MFESEEFPGNFETDIAAFVDPRTSSNGVRILCSEGSFTPDNDVNILTDDQSTYETTRMILGLPEGSKDLKNKFPLQMNLHYLNGVSFDKGCYIGQELTQRTYFTGVTRKALLPFVAITKGANT